MVFFKTMVVVGGPLFDDAFGSERSNSGASETEGFDKAFGSERSNGCAFGTEGFDAFGSERSDGCGFWD